MFYATTLFRAIRRPDGKNVCVDADHLLHTTKVVRTEREFDIAKGQGWTEHPDEALARLESEQEAVSDAAAARAYDDLRMSDKAKAEADAYEATVPGHVVVIPEIVKPPKGKKIKV